MKYFWQSIKVGHQQSMIFSANKFLNSIFLTYKHVKLLLYLIIIFILLYVYGRINYLKLNPIDLYMWVNNHLMLIK